MSSLPTKYEERIQERSQWHFILGLLPRFQNYIGFEFARMIGRWRGAKIGKTSLIPLRLAWKLNSNVFIGEHVSIDTHLLDTRLPLTIHDQVIIGKNVEIITMSHDIDSEEWEHKDYSLEIDEYVWLATKALILPSCRKIGRGAVVGAGSVVSRNIGEMEVVGGNPAQTIRQRGAVHSSIVVESLRGGDLVTYWKTRRNRSRKNS